MGAATKEEYINREPILQGDCSAYHQHARIKTIEIRKNNYQRVALLHLSVLYIFPNK